MLLHGEKRHRIGRTIAEAHARLRLPHRIGERAAPDDEDGLAGSGPDRGEPCREGLGEGKASAELHDVKGAHAQPLDPCSPVAAGAGWRRIAASAVFSRVISTPTAAGPVSSFSTPTTTLDTRGWPSTAPATRSASTSTSSTCPSATIRRIASVITS